MTESTKVCDEYYINVLQGVDYGNIWFHKHSLSTNKSSAMNFSLKIFCDLFIYFSQKDISVTENSNNK